MFFIKLIDSPVRSARPLFFKGAFCIMAGDEFWSSFVLGVKNHMHHNMHLQLHYS